MLKKFIATFVVATVLALSLSLVGCNAPDATGYQGQLEDGKSFVFIEINGNIFASLADDEHQGEDADTYSGKAPTDGAGTITLTNEDSGKTMTITLTENSDGTYDVDVEGHGKGTLKPYEGDILEVLTAMAEDDAEASK